MSLRTSIMMRAVSNGSATHGDMGDQAVVSHLNHVDVRVAEVLDVEKREARVAETLRENGQGKQCVDCPTLISEARLKAKPHAIRCIECQERFEQASSARARSRR